MAATWDWWHLAERVVSEAWVFGRRGELPCSVWVLSTPRSGPLWGGGLHGQRSPCLRLGGRRWLLSAGLACGGGVLWPAARDWVRVAADSDTTLSVQVLEVSRCDS